LAIANSRSSNEPLATSCAISPRSSRASASRDANFAFSSSRLKIWPKSKPHHHMPPTIATSTAPIAARHGHDSRVRTAILGALIPKCRRTRRHQAGVANQRLFIV
jgi:hypothetical protein